MSEVRDLQFLGFKKQTAEKMISSSIDITQLTDDDVGRTVMYVPKNQKNEVGTITSFNDTFIFVCYDDSGRGQATKPQDLNFVGG